MEIKFKKCNTNNYSGVRQATKYIVVHFTSNRGDTAKNNADYFAREIVKASAHFFVDEKEAWSSVPENMTAWHCGAKTYKHPSCRNSNSIGVEICMNDKQGRVRQGSIDNAMKLVKTLMKKYSISVENVVRHYDVTGKYCPGPMVDDPALWQTFKNKLKDDEEVTTKIPIMIDGKEYTVSALNKDDINYIKIRDLVQAGYLVDYDPVKQIPIIKNPFVKGTPVVSDELSRAITIIKSKAGLEDSTIIYLMNYTYGKDLIIKLASSM